MGINVRWFHRLYKLNNPLLVSRALLFSESNHHLSFSPQLQEIWQRTKAFKIIAGTFGVMSVRLEREQGKLVVEGEQVEIAVLAQTLTKKVGRTEIVHVSEY
ncbi:uncharacterized protein LOC106401020 isoform X1 [Brassica napus]|uniref:uncharacterized protein LOC106401020 isoform X1 n=1 Tax=Brassica napus TaxID=3708 RepID=UPI000BBF2B9A|nr:uncharacterized protein LOC106401020 isoform X1 [Brassica napus]